MTQEPTVQPQTFDYYNFYVIQNYVFNEPAPVIENSYTYEENGVLYCATATEKGVYCYTYARNNPLMYTDPSGEFIQFLIPVIIGVVAAATTYTVQVARMPGSFQQNWDWGKFALNTMFGAVTGALSMGIGMAVTPALAAVGISGFLGGAITGATTGAFTGTMSGLMQYGMTGDANAIWKGTLIGAGTGALIGGISGGIQAKMDGRRFWDGAKYTRETISSDIPLVGQKGRNNCGPAGVEAVDKKMGGDFTQEQVRGWYRNKTGRVTAPKLPADDLWTDYTNKRGYGLEIFDPSTNNLEPSDIFTSMKNGDIIAINSSQHTTVMNQAIRESLVKVNGTIKWENYYFNWMDPANSVDYEQIAFNQILKATNLYFIRP